MLAFEIFLTVWWCSIYKYSPVFFARLVISVVMVSL